MMRIWEDRDCGCSQRVCVDVSSRELLPVLRIEVILECLADSDVPICDASVAIPFEVHPSCDLMHE